MKEGRLRLGVGKVWGMDDGLGVGSKSDTRTASGTGGSNFVDSVDILGLVGGAEVEEQHGE